MTVYLKYSNDNWTSESADSFSALEFKPIYTSIKLKGQTLSDIEYEHVSATKSGSRKMIIGANELANDTNFAYIEAWFNAAQKKYSEDNWSTECVVVTEETGDLPVEYLDNDKGMRKVTLTLIQKAPD